MYLASNPNNFKIKLRSRDQYLVVHYSPETHYCCKAVKWSDNKIDLLPQEDCIQQCLFSCRTLPSASIPCAVCYLRMCCCRRMLSWLSSWIRACSLWALLIPSAPAPALLSQLHATSRHLLYGTHLRQYQQKHLWGIIQPKTKNLSLITPPHVVPNL